MMKKICFLLGFLLAGILTFAQPNEGVEMADVMRSSGKIYVVVGVLSFVFIGISIYLFTLDRRISSLEKQLKD